MHELGLMKGVVETAIAEAQRAGATRVLALNLVLQDDGHTDPDALALHFEALARGTIAEGALLNFDRRDSEWKCWTCGNVFTRGESAALCPQCGSPSLPVARADVFYLDTIEVE